MAAVEEIPADVRAALEAEPQALTSFDALPPSHRSEYLRWISEAKKPVTRARRIAGMIERLTAKPST